MCMLKLNVYVSTVLLILITLVLIFILQCMIFDKFVGFATEEEMLTESAKMVENNTLWGGEISKKRNT